MMMLTCGRLVPMISLREVSGSSDATIPAVLSNGVVSSKMRPFDRAILMFTWQVFDPGKNRPERSVCPLDAGAQLTEFFFDTFVAAVEVVHPVHPGFALRYQPGQHQARRGPQI